jgi:hypothetical protein
MAFVSAGAEISVPTLPCPHYEAVTLLRDLPRFRYLWLSKAISSTGTGVGLIALVLFVACLSRPRCRCWPGHWPVQSPTGWTSAACWPPARPGRESSMPFWP